MTYPPDQRDFTAAHQLLEQDLCERCGVRQWEPLASLARELQDSIGAIRGAVSIMECAEKLPGAMERARRVIGNHVGQLAVLMDDLIELESVARGTLKLRRDWIDLAAEVEAAVLACPWAFAGHQQALSLEVPDAPMYAYVDALRLRQVITNLLDSVCRDTRALGRVTVLMRRVGEEAILTVKENVADVASECLRNVRQPPTLHVSGSEAGTVRSEIGLALVRELVALHGGTVERRIAGSTIAFVVRWPLGSRPLLTAIP